MLTPEQIKSRLIFYVWCNMHWPGGPQVRFPIQISILRFRVQVDVWHPKKWFEDLPYEYEGESAQTCYLYGDIPLPVDESDLLDVQLQRIWDSF